MAVILKTPGVFIEEVNETSAVTDVATAVPAFVGYTENIPPLVEGNIPPMRITSMLEYEAVFGGPDKRILVTLSGANDAIASVTDYGVSHILFYSVKMYFDNGGGPCYITSAGVYPAVGATQISKPSLLTAISLLEFEDEPTLLLVPEATQLFNIGYWADVSKELLSQCAKLQDRFAILDTYERSTLTLEIDDFRSNIGSQNLNYGAVYYPRLDTTLPYEFEGEDTSSITLKLIDSSYKTVAQAVTDTTITASFAETVIQEIANQNFDDNKMILPPSGAIAGVYAATDRTRGVWKAPANVSLNSVSSPSLLLTNIEQEDLNVHTTGKSVNAIRSFTGKGIVVWGSRTLEGNSNEWRFVPVRRTFIMVEEALKNATQSVVFETNDESTWLRIRSMSQNFLNSLWRQGAFAGAKPTDAYFVNVGIGETMTAQDILEGRLIIDVGIAAVRPAEFIVLRFTHKLQES